MSRFSDYIDYDDVCYNWLATEARQRRSSGDGHGVDDLLAMTQRHDPFYRGTESDRAKAVWFGKVWKRLGLDVVTQHGQRVHLRRMHYLLVSRSAELPPIAWGGSPGPYLNTLDHWEGLLSAALNARYLGVVSFAAIEDQRNPSPRLFANKASDPDPEVSVEQSYQTFAYLPYELVAHLPTYEMKGYDADQRYHCEVWVEKSTMEDVLLPVCRLWGVNLMHAAGELSITQVHDATRRIIGSGKSARILYISDYDPAGQRMPVSAGRKLEWFMHSPDSPLHERFSDYAFDGHDVTLTPIALTEEQIEEYDLPRQPLKEQRGKDQWELLRGAGGVELDALEALHPGKLTRIVEGRLSHFYDGDLKARVKEACTEAQNHLETLRQEVLDEHREALKALQREYRTFFAEARPRMDAITRALEEELGTIKSELEKAVEDLDIAEEFPVPEAEEAEDDEPEDALLWSDRSYDEQLEAYHTFQRRDELPGAA